jgi:hypothetical protein
MKADEGHEESAMPLSALAGDAMARGSQRSGRPGREKRIRRNLLKIGLAVTHEH